MAEIRDRPLILARAGAGSATSPCPTYPGSSESLSSCPFPLSARRHGSLSRANWPKKRLESKELGEGRRAERREGARFFGMDGTKEL